jgi:hypothetical protein
MILRRAFASMAALLLAGCAALNAPFNRHLESSGDDERECAQWFVKLDRQVAAAGVGDAQDARVAGFPYLRVNRLLAALRPLAESNEQVLPALAERMLALDQEARRVEIMNLPAGEVPALPEAALHTQNCGKLLRNIDMAKPEARQVLLARMQVPDDYSSASRVLGLYALTKFAFASGVRRYEAETREAFAREPAAPACARGDHPPARRDESARHPGARRFGTRRAVRSLCTQFRDRGGGGLRPLRRAALDARWGDAGGGWRATGGLHAPRLDAL